MFEIDLNTKCCLEIIKKQYKMYKLQCSYLTNSDADLQQTAFENALFFSSTVQK